MKPYITLILFLTTGIVANAQQLEVQTDIVSQNIWRGTYIAGASIQPSITASKGNFELTVWSSTALHEDEYEVDAILSYSFGNLCIGITDYWSDAVKARYGKGHLLEFNAEYNFAYIPLMLSWNTSLDNCHSSYAEINYCKQISDMEVGFSAGLTPWKNKMLETNGFAFTKLAVCVSKELKAKNISIKPSCTLVYNPAADQLFVVAGIGFLF